VVELVVSGGKTGDFAGGIGWGESLGEDSVMVAMASSSLTGPSICDHARWEVHLLPPPLVVGCTADGRRLPRSRRPLPGHGLRESNGVMILMECVVRFVRNV